MLRIFIILVFFVNSCKSNEVKNNPSSSKVHQLVEEKAKEYIKELHQVDENYSLFVYAEIKDNDSNKDYYEAVIYAHTILWDEFPVLPYSFIRYEYKGNKIIYFFDESEQIKMDKSNPIYEKLKDEKLIKSIDSKTKKEEIELMLDDSIESWNLFICKNNLEKIKIVKSNYVLESNEKPNSVCK